MSLLTLRELHPGFAAEASGIDLSEPLDADGARAIEAAMDRHGVLVFRGQQLDQDQQMRFAEAMGPLDVGFGRFRKTHHRFKHEALADMSNVGPDGELVSRDHPKIVGNIANQLWHSDSSFQRPRAKYSMLYSVVVPNEGGQTEFADLRAAHDALPPELLEQVQGRFAEHFALHSRFLLGDTNYNEAQRALMPPVCWPLSQTHPGSGRKVLYVGIHAQSVVGMTLPEGRMLIMDLLEHATQRAFVYRHEWRVGDLVMWDNTATVHRGRRYDFSRRRELRRSTTLETVEPVEARDPPPAADVRRAPAETHAAS